MPNTESFFVGLIDSLDPFSSAPVRGGSCNEKQLSERGETEAGEILTSENPNISLNSFTAITPISTNSSLTCPPGRGRQQHNIPEMMRGGFSSTISQTQQPNCNGNSEKDDEKRVQLNKFSTLRAECLPGQPYFSQTIADIKKLLWLPLAGMTAT
ncbi:hypothetical protein NQZ68_023017 [Dissostichus eleginoides]|nr:hypothetical protein NQZ68_023017 [Dissostichus eleginoides]